MNKEFCIKGTDYFRKQLQSLNRAKLQVEKNPTINSIHLVRTSCRRLRNALQFYRKYLKKVEYKKYSKIFSMLMTKSGQLRDLDVLSQYLDNTLKSNISDKYKFGIHRVNLRIKQRREKLIPRLVNELVNYDMEAISNKVKKIFDKQYSKKEEDNPVSTKTDVIRKFINFVEKCSDSTNSYYSNVIDESKVEELHDYRKEVKKQRYTLEFFNSQFRFNLSSQIEKLKYYQELLGAIHDADIWMEFFKEFLIREEKRTLKYYGKKSPMNVITPGIHFLITDLKSMRNEKYKTFVENFKKELGNDYWLGIYSLITK